MPIRSFQESDVDEIVDLSLRAWAPVFASIEREMEPEVFRYFFPDWRDEQRKAVRTVCADKEARIWVWENEGAVDGFVALYRRLPTFGEIHMIAVDPQAQQQGIGRALTDHAIHGMRESGIQVAMVETGGDPGHAPARRLYERSGFRLWPVARYFRNLAPVESAES